MNYKLEENRYSKDKEDLFEDLKTDINAFLYERLPDETTLKEMESVAMVVYSEFVKIWDEHDPTFK